MFTARCSRRRIVALPVAAAAAAAAGACTRGESDPDALTLFAANSPWAEGVKTLAQEYERETGIAVHVETYGNEQLNDTYKVKLNARSTDVDLMAYQPQDVIREFTHNGWLTDLTDRVEADPAWNWQDFQAPAREAVTLDGAVYGVPVMTERHVVYYRADLLEAANLPVPATLDELEATAAALHDPDGGRYGIAMRGALVPLVTQFSSFLYSFGGDFQDADGNAALDAAEAVEAYEYYGRLLREYGPPGATNMGWVEASAIFAQGKAVFYVDADSQAYTFLDESASAVVDTVAYARFPAGPAGSKFYNIVPQCLGVNAYSEKQDKAWDFLAWATSEANSKRLLVEQTAPPARQSAWDDPESAAAYPEALVAIIRDAEGSVAYDRPRLEQVARAREYAGEPAVTAIEGGDVPEAAREANDEFQELLDYEQ